MRGFLSKDHSNVDYVNIEATDAPDLSSVSRLDEMFWGAKSFNADISHWDISHVSNINIMFVDCDKFNQDISRWSISSLKSAIDVFGSTHNKVICDKCDSIREKLKKKV